MVCYLENYSPEKFAEIFLGEFDTPEAIWNAEMRSELWILPKMTIVNDDQWLQEYITILVFSGYVSFVFVNSLMSWFFVVGEWWLRRSHPTLPISRRGYRVTLAPCTSTVPFQWSTTHNSSMNCSAIYIILSISVILRNSQIGRLRIQYVFTVYSVLLYTYCICLCILLSVFGGMQLTLI